MHLFYFRHLRYCTFIISVHRVIRVIVPAINKAIVSLNPTYIDELEIGSQNKKKVTATLTGGQDYREQDLTWEFSKVNGETIGKILGSGSTVEIYGIKPGTTKLTASLPNGNKSFINVTFVEVRKLSMNSTSIQVEPGQKKQIEYTLNPISDTLSIATSATDMTGNVYVKVTDKGKKKDVKGNLTNIGVIEVEGVSSGDLNNPNAKSMTTCLVQSSSGKSVVMSISVGWDYKFVNSNDTTFTITPDETKTLKFDVYPEDSNVKVINSSVANSFTYKSVTKDGKATVTITPKKEIATPVTFEVVATNPKSDDCEFGKHRFTSNIVYSDVKPELTKVTSTGNFSYIGSDAIYIGDGEKFTFSAKNTNKKANVEITNIKFDKWRDNNSEYDNLSVGEMREQTDGSCQFILEHKKDYEGHEYEITAMKEPYKYKYEDIEYDNSYSYPNGTKIISKELEDEPYDYKKFKWFHYYKNHNSGHDPYFGLVTSDWIPTRADHPTDPSIVYYSYSGYMYGGSVNLGITVTKPNWFIVDGIVELPKEKWFYEKSSTDSEKVYYTNWQSVLASSQYPSSWVGLTTEETINEEEQTNSFKLQCNWTLVDVPKDKLAEKLGGRTVFSEKEFRETPYFYCPGSVESDCRDFEVKYSDFVNGTNKNGLHDGRIIQYARVMEPFVSAIYRVVSNKTITDNMQIGNITITYKHNGQQKTDVYPLYYNRRDCSKTQK